VVACLRDRLGAGRVDQRDEAPVDRDQ